MNPHCHITHGLVIDRFEYETAARSSGNVLHKERAATSLTRVGRWQQHGKGAAPSCSANSEGTGNLHLSLALHEVSAHGLCLALLLHIGPEVPLMKSLQRIKKSLRGKSSLLRSTGSGCCCEAEAQCAHNHLASKGPCCTSG